MYTSLATAVLSILFLTGSAVANAQTVGIDFVPNNFTMYVGQTRTVNITGASVYYLNGNENPRVASAVLSGSFVTVSGLNAGTDKVSICTYGANNSVTCGSINFTVLAAATTQPTTPSTVTSTLYFDRSQVSLDVGKSTTVKVTGSGLATGAGAYYVADASSNVASVSLSGDMLTLTGNEIGGENIRVCQVAGACANLYVYIASTQANALAAQTVRKVNPGLSAIYIASNGAQFLSQNSVLTIKFNTNVDITSHVLRVGSQSVQVNGTSSGPYSATYTLTGAETYPLPVSLDYWASDGTAGHTSFTISDTGMPTQTYAPTASTAYPSGTTKFSKALNSGSSGTEVTALQTLLRKLGYYSGPVTGNYGPLTAAAVKKYQAARGLDQLGIVGPGTRAALNKEK